MAYAAATSVPVDRSKSHIEQLLIKHGAAGFHTGWQASVGSERGWDAIEFLWKGKQIRFRLNRPIAADFRGSRGAIERAIDQRNRQRWRVLFLVVKAKLEAVEAGIAIFEEEFMPFNVTSSGRTIGEILVPRIQAASGPLQLESGAERQ